MFSIPVSFIWILVMCPLHWLRTWAPALQVWPMIWPDDDIFTSRSPEKSHQHIHSFTSRSTNTLPNFDSIYVFVSAPIHQKSHEIPSEIPWNPIPMLPAMDVFVTACSSGPLSMAIPHLANPRSLRASPKSTGAWLSCGTPGASGV